MPSPVQMSALVVGMNSWPLPPVARITDLAVNSSKLPSRMLRVTAPAMRPESSRTRAVVNHSS